jgi:hypothetical protein
VPNKGGNGSSRGCNRIKKWQSLSLNRLKRKKYLKMISKGRNTCNTKEVSFNNSYPK